MRTSFSKDFYEQGENRDPREGKYREKVNPSPIIIKIGRYYIKLDNAFVFP